MNRCGKLAVAVLLSSVCATSASAQIPIGVFIGGGASIPTGDFGDMADTGWMIGGGILGLVGTQGVWIGAEGMYGKNGLKEIEDYDVELVGGGGMIGFSFNSAARISPYIFGSAGVLSSKVSGEGVESDSESEFAWGGGAGVSIGLSPRASLFASGRYIAADELKFIPVTAGVLIYLSGPQ